jgi:RHS repeat-associated protein
VGGYASVYQDVLFTGRTLDRETWNPGSNRFGLYYYRARYYDAETGRFLQRDPIGIWGDGVGLGNGYAYVGNDLANLTDPYGEKVDIDVKDVPCTKEDQDFCKAACISQGYTDGRAISCKYVTVTTIVNIFGVTVRYGEGKRFALCDCGSFNDKRKDIEKSPKDWEKVSEKNDPPNPNRGKSTRELWKKRGKDEYVEKHVLEEKSGKPRSGHPHYKPVGEGSWTGQDIPKVPDNPIESNKTCMPSYCGDTFKEV